MTDEDLIARLRKYEDDLLFITADRIEAQAAEIERLEKACAEWAEVSQSNYQRAKAAEAKLAKAVDALEEIATDEHPLGWIALTALVELTGATQ